jgi:hypothetical protein
MAGGPRPRTRVRERVAACEHDVERFNRETNTGPELFLDELETYNLSDGSGGAAQGTSGSEWYQRFPTRDGIDDVARGNSGSEWCRRPQTRSSERKDRDNGGSVAVSSAGGGASGSLDGHTRERDVILARLELQRAQEETCRAEQETRRAEEETHRIELQLAELDAEAGLSRRSRNSSQASSLHSGGRSTASGAHRSHRLLSPDRDRSLGVALAEVIEVDEGQVAIPHADSRADTPFYSVDDIRSQGSMSVGNLSSVGPEATRTSATQDAYRRPSQSRR